MSYVRLSVFTVSMIALMGAAHAADLRMPVKAPPVETQPPVSGYLELYTGGAWNRETETGESESSRAWVLGGAGRVNYWWAPTASMQFDVQGDGGSYTGQTTGPVRFSAYSYLIGAHVNWRNQNGLLGIFGGAGDVSPDEISNTVTTSLRHGLIGAEGQLYWNAITLYAQGGYDSTVGSYAPAPGTMDSVHAWFARGTVRGYFTPNDRLEGTFMYSSGSHNFTAGVPNVGFNQDLWRVKYEHRFNASPFSLFAEYQGTRLSFTDEVQYDNRVLGGLRIYLNEGTLRMGDTSGATLDIIEPLSLLTPSLN